MVKKNYRHDFRSINITGKKRDFKWKYTVRFNLVQKNITQYKPREKIADNPKEVYVSNEIRAKTASKIYS